MKNNRIPEILSPQQEALLNRLLPVARIAITGGNEHLPVRPRTHTVIVGPSGGGKSHLARSLGKRLGGVPIMVINVSSWVILSAKNEPWTFSLICDWLSTLGPKGGILVLEEIDKLALPPSEWKSYISLEIHDVLDGIIPMAARLPSNPVDELWGETANEPPNPALRKKLAKCLRNRVFVIGCGAWQAAWEAKQTEIGFESKAPQPSRPSPEQLQSISPELRKRFRSEVGWLPPLGLADYLKVSRSIANRISDPQIRRAWTALEGPAIRDAMTNGLGMRVFEELMLSAMLGAAHQVEPGIDPPSI